MITADVYEVEDFYEFSTGPKVTVRVTLSDSALVPEEAAPHNVPVLSARRGRGKRAARKGGIVRVPVAVAVAAKRLRSPVSVGM